MVINTNTFLSSWVSLCVYSSMVVWCFIANPVLAQSTDNTGWRSRIIIKWKQHKTHTAAQSLEATSNDMQRIVGVTMQRRRGISETMDGMQLQRPLSRAQFAKALSKLNANPDVEFAVEDKRRFPCVDK